MVKKKETTRNYSIVSFAIGVAMLVLLLPFLFYYPPNVIIALFIFVPLLLGAFLCFVCGLVVGFAHKRHKGMTGIWLNSLGLFAIVLPIVWTGATSTTPEKVSRELLEQAEQGDEDARIRLEKYAEEGPSYARFYLGLMYKNGRAVPRDYVLAYFWISRATATAMLPEQKKTYRDFLDEMSQEMTVGQIAEAEGLLANWKPEPKGPRPILKRNGIPAKDQEQNDKPAEKR
jgi:hypothetical protein